MQFLVSLFLILIGSLGALSKTISYLDNIGNDGMFIYSSKEEVMDRYSVLAEDPNERLPEVFTICSSVFLNYRTSASHFSTFTKMMGDHGLQST